MRTTPTIGGLLNNGALILDLRPQAPGEFVALCSRGSEDYVTWRVDRDGNAYLGHYFTLRPGFTREQALTAAALDFDAR